MGQIRTAKQILSLLHNRELVTCPFVRKQESTNPARFLLIYIYILYIYRSSK